MNEYYENQVGSNRNVWTEKHEQVLNDYLTNVEEGLTKKNTHYFYEQKYELATIDTVTNQKMCLFQGKYIVEK